MYIVPKTIIGCQDHPNCDWLKWDAENVAEFADGAKEFWQDHGDGIKAVIRNVMQKP